jgi:glycosyltransferase involved in cell wall biosynthesis
VVLTYNEERNLEACLASVAEWADETFVVDSGSTDGTVGIARRFGAQVVTHAFETHARQWQWALDTLPLRHPWVLGIDADQRVTPGLRDDMRALIESDSDAAGAYVARRQIFRGKWIRYGGYYPVYLLKLFRRDRVRLDPDDLVDHHFRVTGRVVTLRGDLIEDNRNEAQIAVWTAKHNRYAVLQARRERQLSPHVPVSALFRGSDDRVLWLKQLWNRFPLFLRPVLYVFYRYVIRLGFLDGKEGFIFHVLQAFWYRLLVDINIDELRSQSSATPAEQPSSKAAQSVATSK